ncbi:unnamed protein product [Amoebophrya sp. A25]|nr:unnamed protein product [Amoebophrya sp. A25]|eukprot:GSA25T00010174001.1
MRPLLLFAFGILVEISTAISFLRERREKIHQQEKQQSPTTSSSCFDAGNWYHAFTGQWRHFSQGNQDAVLASLFDKRNLGLTNRFMVEFGYPAKDIASSYGNGHNLITSGLMQNWVLLDGGVSNSAIHLFQEFLTAQNVREVFQKHQVVPEPDYVSVDIDSCDLWLFMAITGGGKGGVRNKTQKNEEEDQGDGRTHGQELNSGARNEKDKTSAGTRRVLSLSGDTVNEKTSTTSTTAGSARTSIPALPAYRPRVMTVEYNSNYALGDFTSVRPAACSQYQWHQDNIYGASLSAIHLAAEQRGYKVVYVTPTLDVFLVREDLVCPGTALPIQTFASATGLSMHYAYTGGLGPREQLVGDARADIEDSV